MIGKIKILAVIPARGGSKRLPRKNIRNLCGKPLIAWTIESALSSKYIDKIIVSTDDKEIAEISERYGPMIPFIRPRELSTQNAKNIHVARHALGWFYGKREFYEAVVVLQPTSPLSDTSDIDNAIEDFAKRDTDCLVSASEKKNVSDTTGFTNKDRSLNSFRQTMNFFPKRMRDWDMCQINGAIYIVKSNVLFDDHTESFLDVKNGVIFFMDEVRAVDIDTKLDFYLAELIISNKLNEV